MARKKANYPLIEGLEITTLAAEGKAMGRYNDVVVFVPMTVPGDVVDVQIRSKRRRYMEGFVVNYVKRSPLREEPFCAHFGVCGGCKWQNLPYAEQLRFKTEQVRDQLARIGKVELPEIAPCLPSAETRFTATSWSSPSPSGAGSPTRRSPKRARSPMPRRWDSTSPVCSTKCWTSKMLVAARSVECDPGRNPAFLPRTRLYVPQSARAPGADAQHGRPHRLDGRGDGDRGFHADEREKIAALLDHLAAAFPEITSLFYVINEKFNDSTGDLEPVCYRGKDHIIERMEGLQFKVGPKSFYQTNSAQAYELYKVARDFAALTGKRFYTTFTPARVRSPTSVRRGARRSWAWSTCPRPSRTPASIRR